MASTFVSMYTGAGGLDLGFVSVGLQPVFANDISVDAMLTYKAAMSELARREIIDPDLHKVKTGDIRLVDELPARHSADLVIGGPPCQGFSVAGKMDPNDPRSRHVFDFLAMVEHVNPKGFVMENVKALAVNSRWQRIRAELISKAEAMGYRTKLLVLNASDFGVPQARERMFLIGLKPEYFDRFVAPKPIPERKSTVRDALSALPAFGQPGNDQICKAIITPAKNPILRKSPWAGMLFNGQGRPMDLDRPAPTLPASMGGNRTPIIDQEALELQSEHWVIEYHKQLLSGGSIAESIPPKLRRLTVNEAAAIQTFPKDMPWHGSQSSRYKQIGNAVPPRLARTVALSMVKAIKGDSAINDRSYVIDMLSE